MTTLLQSNMFQSTPPHGERPVQPYIGMRMQSFNPRPRTGSDDGSMTTVQTTQGFNPRPRTGSDYWLSASFTSCHSFNPRPRTGSDIK